MKKAMLLILCGALCALVFSCASGGGGGGGAAASGGEAISGVWEFSPKNDANDGGNSVIDLDVAEEVINGETVTTYRVHGSVGTTARGYGGVVDVTMTPDEATLEVIKKLTPTGAISFKVQGDGRPYHLEAPISTVTDWGFHRFTFNTEPGVTQEVKIQMRMFLQPSWATEVRFNRERITGFRFATLSTSDGGEGPFDFKVWDIKIHP